MLASTWKNGTSGKVSSEVTLITVAPYSANILPMVGPAIIRQSSSTLTPSRIFLDDKVAANSIFGVDVSSVSTSNGELY